MSTSPRIGILGAGGRMGRILIQAVQQAGYQLARILLDNWNHYVDQFIQVVPIEYKKVLQEEQMRKLQQKIADMQRDY
jgi:glutamate synthase domain-containing protein 3